MYQKNTFLCLCWLFSTIGVLAQSDSDEPDYTDYGGKLSIGISILDGFGVPVRIYSGPHTFEGGLYMAPVALIEDNDLVEVRIEPMLGLGYTYFGTRFLKEKKKRDKIRANGIALRLNRVVGNYTTTTPSLSWAQETFRPGRKNRSFLFELGIQYSIPDYTDPGIDVSSQVGVRLRCQWNLFIK